MNPRAWDIVNDLKSGWRDWARRMPILAMLPFNLPPFILASVYNYYYNEREFIAKQTDEVIIRAFHWLVPPINTVLFALGIILVFWYAWPVTTALHCLAAGRPCEGARLRGARGRSITLGHGVAFVGMALWLVAGISFPLGVQLQTGKTPDGGYVHFLLSMALCGLISCCFPFLATTWLTVRIFFPALLASTSPDHDEQKRLAALSRHAGYASMAAAVVPMLALMLLPFSGPASRAFTLTMIAAGIVGFIAAYFASQRLRADLAALSVATRPADMIGTTTDTVDTY
jgi:hypothetical protein